MGVGEKGEKEKKKCYKFKAFLLSTEPKSTPIACFSLSLPQDHIGWNVTNWRTSSSLLKLRTYRYTVTARISAVRREAMRAF